MTNNVYLIWLEWPEKCFRVDAEALRCLRGLLPTGARIVRARDERSFLRRLPEATHAIVWHFHREWFARAPRLKVLATPGAGRELVTREVPRGVRLHFGGFHGDLMAESVAGFILAWARGFFRPEARLPWGRVELSDKCYTVAGTRAVVVGYGRVGRAIGRKLEELGVSVFGLTRHGLFAGARRAKASACRPEEVLRTADWLVMALPSDTGTDDFLNARLLAALPRRCVVANVGRGNAVDEAALLKALRSGRLAGAYLDVFKEEPSALKGVAKARGQILKAGKKIPWNLIKMPHSCAFSANYLKMCFEELKHDGLL